MVSKIAQNAISATPFAPVSAVFGAIVLLVKAADGVSEAYDWIETLFNKLGSFTQRLDAYTNAGMTPHMQGKVVEILACLLELIGKSEAVMKSGRFRKYAGATFLGKDDGIKDSLTQLNALFDDEQRLVQATAYETVNRIEYRTMNLETVALQTSDATTKIASALQGMSIPLKLKCC
jgi:hypothetical protein